MPAFASVSSLSASVLIAHVVQLSKKWQIMRSADTSIIVPSLIVLRNKSDVSITEADIHVDVERSLQLLANAPGRFLVSQINHLWVRHATGQPQPCVSPAFLQSLKRACKRKRVSVSESTASQTNISTNVARCFFCRPNARMSELPILQIAARGGAPPRIAGAAPDSQRSGNKRRKLLRTTDGMLTNANMRQ